MRLPLLPASDISDDRRQLYDAFTANVRDNFPDIVTMREDGALLGPWGVWMQRPDVGRPMLQLIEAIRSIPGLSPAARQVVILMAGGRYRAAYEIYAHAAAARHAGLSDQQIATLLAGGRPAQRLQRAQPPGILTSGVSRLRAHRRPSYRLSERPGAALTTWRKVSRCPPRSRRAPRRSA